VKCPRFAFINQSSDDATLNRHHSFLIASIGFILTALLAGIIPASAPEIIRIIKAVIAS